MICASMGTMITRDGPEVAWASHSFVNCVFQGLTRKELCQAAWESSDADLLLLSLGPQPDALENLPAPPNVFCLCVMAQLDVLRSSACCFLSVRPD